MMKRIGHFYLISMVVAACAVVSVSCDKSDPDNVFGPNAKTKGIKLNVTQTSEFVETKAGNIAKLNNVFGSEDDGFVIEEYVSDMDGNIPETKGWEIITDNIVSKYGEFNVMAFLDTLDKDKNTVHVNEFNLTSKHTGSEWTWYKGSSAASEKDSPKWRTSTATRMWSYAPTSLALTADGNVTDGTQGWADGEYDKLTFSHTVPATDFTAQQDLIFAFNNETRDFKKDAEGNYPIDPVTKKPIFEFVDGQGENVNIHFYHALAAVKFELGSGMDGVDVHKITIGTGRTVQKGGSTVTTSKLFSTGTCIINGPQLASPVAGTAGAGTGGVAWTNLGNAATFEQTYTVQYPLQTGTQTIANGYASTGEGVLFMIPQQADNVEIAVEFSKYGGETYTVRKQLINVNWKAGKYYTYKLTGEIHVPGEMLTASATVDVDGLKNSSDQKVFKATSATTDTKGDFKVKGVTKVGMILEKKYVKNTSGSQNFSFVVAPNGEIPSIIPTSESFSFNFRTVNIPTGGSSLTTIYQFGLEAGDEDYTTVYNETMQSTKGSGETTDGPYYYVFKVEGLNTFNICYKTSSTSNSGVYQAPVRCLMILEVKNDDNKIYP